MSIFIKGIHMPVSCANCYFSRWENGYGDICIITNNFIKDTNKKVSCPLVEIPTPHGDLVDVQAIEEIRFHDADGYHWINGEQLCELEIDALIVIKAEDR